MPRIIALLGYALAFVIAALAVAVETLRAVPRADEPTGEWWTGA